jgi:hypothetical protein
MTCGFVRMKRLKVSLAAGVLVALAIGCRTTSREDMLTAAGFRTVRADTAPKVAHLHSLPPHQITTVERNGTVFYVFPDIERNTLYVGQQQQYQRYQQLRHQRELPDEPLTTAVPNENTWAIWGPWWGWGWQ